MLFGHHGPHIFGNQSSGSKRHAGWAQAKGQAIYRTLLPRLKADGDTQLLLGTAMLSGKTLTIDFVEGLLQVQAPG